MRSHVHAVCRPLRFEESDTLAKLPVPWIPRENRAGAGIDLGHDERRAQWSEFRRTTESTYAVIEKTPRAP